MKKICIPIFIILIAIFGYLWMTNQKNSLEKIGYSKQEIKKIEKLNAENINYLKGKERISHIEEILDHKDFKEQNLKNYISYMETNKNATIEEIITKGNTKDTTNQPEEKPPVDSTESKLAKEQYYIAGNLDRYLNYIKENPNYDLSTVVSYVNTGLDSEYYTNVVATDMSKDTLVLVNKYNKLNDNYEADDLVKLSGRYNQGTYAYLRKVAYDAFIELSDAAKQEGYNIFNLSAYRSFNTQNRLYNNYVASDGKANADTYSARPGYSEHQTGLALDVNDIEERFENTKEFKWLQNNAHKYGFILRYPKGKEKITGYVYEPWHYRYVGTEIATYIHEHDITYDEYYAYFLQK